MARTHVWYVSSIWVTWLIHMWCDPFSWVQWRMHTVTVRHDPSMGEILIITERPRRTKSPYSHEVTGWWSVASANGLKPLAAACSGPADMQKSPQKCEDTVTGCWGCGCVVYCSNLSTPRNFLIPCEMTSERYRVVPGHKTHFFDAASEFLSTNWWSQNPACQRCVYKPLKNCHPASEFLYSP